MKSLITVLLFAAFATVASAQINKIELKSIGFVGIPDSTKNYALLEYPKMTKADLYKKTLTYLNGIYKNPGQVITAVENESITVNGFTDAIKGGIYFYKYELSYNIVLMFKDGKIRFEPRIVNFTENWSKTKPPRKIYTASTDSPNEVEIQCIYLFNKQKGQYIIFKPEEKSSIETWANNYLLGIDNSIKDNW